MQFELEVRLGMKPRGLLEGSDCPLTGPRSQCQPAGDRRTHGEPNNKPWRANRVAKPARPSTTARRKPATLARARIWRAPTQTSGPPSRVTGACCEARSGSQTPLEASCKLSEPRLPAADQEAAHVNACEHEHVPSEVVRATKTVARGVGLPQNRPKEPMPSRRRPSNPYRA